MENNTYSLIMAGGIGSRFWPMSTQQKPKQFLDVLGVGKSLLRLTFERLTEISDSSKVYVLTNERYRDLVLSQLPELEVDQVICEPERKNTAPCIAFAAPKILGLNPNATLVISPSDHLIINTARFVECINAAVQEANLGQLVTLGIQPTRPDTGYGYIEVRPSQHLPGAVEPVRRFCEKPSIDVAKTFVDSGNYFWNSGIFIWRAVDILDAIKAYANSLYEVFCGSMDAYNSDAEALFMRSAFAAAEDISIDFAVMEHAKNVSVVVSDFDWSDLGTWGSLIDHMDRDDHGNAVVGENVHLFETKNCLVHLPKDKVVLLDGIQDTIIVESDGMLMVLRKDKEQALKTYLKQIEDSNPALFH
jgi:mannose-1-phosphate guanylyltransferase